MKRVKTLSLWLIFILLFLVCANQFTQTGPVFAGHIPFAVYDSDGDGSFLDEAWMSALHWPKFIYTAPLATDDKCFWVAPANLTITAIKVILFTGGPMTITLKECDSAGANCAVCDSAYITADGGLDTDDGSLSNASIDANDVVGVDIDTVNGDEGDFIIWFEFTVD